MRKFVAILTMLVVMLITTQATGQPDRASPKQFKPLQPGATAAKTFVTMREAAVAAQEDLKSIMDGVKLTNNTKENLKKTKEQIDNLAATNSEHECTKKSPVTKMTKVRHEKSFATTKYIAAHCGFFQMNEKTTSAGVDKVSKCVANGLLKYRCIEDATQGVGSFVGAGYQ